MPKTNYVDIYLHAHTLHTRKRLIWSNKVVVFHEATSQVIGRGLHDCCIILK